MTREQEEKLNRIIELLEKAPMKAEEASKSYGEDGSYNYPFALGYLGITVKALAQELKDTLREKGGNN